MARIKAAQTIMKALNKPMQVEVIQYDGLNHSECQAFVGDKALQIMSIDDDGAEYLLLNLRLITLKGTILVQPLSWIIKDYYNQFTVFTDKEFKLYYTLL